MHRMSHIHLGTALAAITSLACSPNKNVSSDLALDAGSLLPDRQSTSATDSGVERFDGGSYYTRGQRINSESVKIVHISEDETEVHLLDENNDLLKTSPDGKESVRLASNVLSITRPASLFWLLTKSDQSNAACHLYSYRPGDSQPLGPLTSTSAYGLLKASPDDQWAMTTDNFGIKGRGETATRTADLVYLKFDGSQHHTLLTKINLGLWDEQEQRFGGKCSPNFVFTSTSYAFAAACLDNAEERSLIQIDLQTLRTSTLASGVLSFLEKHPNSEHVLWADAEQNLYVTHPGEQLTVQLPEALRIEDIQVLGPGHFAYTTESEELKVAHWPLMNPFTIQSFGAKRIRASSPDGRFVVFSPNRETVTSLYMIETSTQSNAELITLSDEEDSYPGDVPFSSDSNYVFWYGKTDQNYVGKLNSIPTNGDEASKLLADEAYFVQTYANPQKLLIMVNAKPNSTNQKIIADLAIRNRDGSDELQVLVPDVQATNYLSFPQSKRVVYSVPTGPHAGIWVRELP